MILELTKYARYILKDNNNEMVVYLRGPAHKEPGKFLVIGPEGSCHFVRPEQLTPLVFPERALNVKR